MKLDELTVVVLARNEERALPAALASLPAGAHILVLDAQSEDSTRQIAFAAGARVIERAWTDFVDARRFAREQVATPWTFMLDADERLDERLRTALAAADPDREGVDGYVVRRTTHFCGAAVHALGWGEERLLRVFRTARGRLEAHPAAGGTAPIHERWAVDGTTGELDGTLLHDSYPDRASYRRKFAHYTSLEAAGMHGSLAALSVALVRAAVRFVWLAGPRGGMRAGWRGLYLAWWSALYPVVAHLKALRR